MQVQKNRLLLAVLAVLVAVVLAGCGGTKVTRTDPGEVIDLSGDWNDIDSQAVAADLVAKITNAAWVQNHVLETGKKPVIIVGTIRNKTVEHIPMKTLTADVEGAFINSGRVSVVATSEEREQIRQERADQQDHSSETTMAQWGRELGADYMLLGELNSIDDRLGHDVVKYYQTDAYLVDLESNLKVWQGQTKTKKLVTGKKVRG